MNIDGRYTGIMQFSEESINKFIAIYERNFNETISREEAIEMARGLVNLYRLFLRPPSLMRDRDPNLG